MDKPTNDEKRDYFSPKHYYPISSDRFVGVLIPSGVYWKLERKLFSLNEVEKEKFFSIFENMYGIGPRKYAERTLPQWKSHSTKLSGTTRDRMLQIIPQIMSTDERFDLFEMIIKKNDLAYRIPCKNHMYECTFEEWKNIRFSVEKAFRDATESYLSQLDYSKRYDLSKIEWIASKDIIAFKTLLENTQKSLYYNKLNRLKDDLDVFEGKWNRFILQHDSTQETEISYEYTIPTDHFKIVIYNKHARDNKKRQDWFMQLGCLIPLLSIFILILLKGCK